jgi:hypothetical protein
MKMSKATTTIAPVAKKNKGMISPKAVQPKLATPPNAFTAFVATQQKKTEVAQKETTKAADKTSMPDAGTAIQQAAKAGFVRTVQNGRKDYTPNSIGALIWQTADALQKATPATPITSAAVRLALPHVKPASVSAGLSHWRKFNGTMRVKAAAVVVPEISKTE